MIRKATAVWRGTGRDGDGDISTDSGVLSETPYSYKTRFENEKGTNPEELIAAAHAGCFTMALAFALQQGGYEPTELTTEAAVTLDQQGQGFTITKSLQYTLAMNFAVPCASLFMMYALDKFGRKITSVCAFICAGLMAIVFANAGTATPQGKQQTKLGTCSKEAKAKSIRGADRRQFMSTCMKAKA